MTGDANLERRYRRLLRWFPAAYRRDHEEEILGVLMAAAPPGRRRPGLVDSANLIWAGLSTRLRFRAGTGDSPSDWADALAIYSVAGPVLILFTAALYEIQGRVVTYLVSLPEHLVSQGLGMRTWQLVAATAIPLVVPGALVAATLLRRRRAGIIIASVGALWYATAVVDAGSIMVIAYSCWYLLAAAALARASLDRGRQLLRRRHVVLPAVAMLLTHAAAVAELVHAEANHWHYSRAAAIGQMATFIATAAGAAIVLARGSGVERRYLALLAVTAYPIAFGYAIGWNWLQLAVSPVPWALVVAALYLPAVLTAVLAIRIGRRRRPVQAAGA